ncbi:MAG: hypothetical protein GX539_05425 [Candidatus Cloacimonetes bacterium]|nr:hypothetical protein [Candidatus Cloacimonadota bacterium]
MSTRVMLLRRWAVAALVAATALPAHASAQQCSAAVLRDASISPASIAFSTPTVVDFDNQGIVYGSVVTVNITSSLWILPLSWSLCVNADTPNLGSSQGVSKPLTDLQVELMDGNWRPITSTQQRLRTGNGNATVQLRVRMRLSWDADPPGTFGTVLRFTVGS